jgi:hypothetical protein
LIIDGRCGSCKFWSKYEGQYADSLGKKAGSCGNDKFVHEADLPIDGLAYWGGELSAGFETGEQFGCVHWEKR